MRSILFILAVVLFSCKDDDLNPVIDSACDDEIQVDLPNCDLIEVCTDDYRVIVIQVIDDSGNPVVFDEFSVTNLTTGEPVVITWLGLIGSGYIIAEDAMFDNLPQEGHCIQLEGSINGEILVQQSFRVGHDCCHVTLLSGPEIIEL